MLDITAHIDGIALRFEGEVVRVFDSLWDARIALNAASSAANDADRRLTELLRPAHTMSPEALNAVAADLQRRIDGDLS